MNQILAGLLLATTACSPLAHPEWITDADRTLGAYRDPVLTVPVHLLPGGIVDPKALLDEAHAGNKVGGIDRRRLPDLATYWKRGEAPPYGVIGEQGTVRVRFVGLKRRDPQAGDPTVEAVYRVLHPLPFHITLQAGEPGREHDLGEARSERWGAGLFYAEIAVPLPENRLRGFEHLRGILEEEGNDWTVTTETELTPYRAGR